MIRRTRDAAMSKRSCTTLLAAACFALAAAGCTDVTVQPKSTVTTANIFNEPGSYKAYLAKLYAGLAVTGQAGAAGNADIEGIDEGFSSYLRLYWQMEELPTDEAAIAWNDAGVQELNTQLWSSSNQFLDAMYGRVFFQVSQANEFLRQTTDAQLAARGLTGAMVDTVHEYRAEARFLRALSYWHGLDLFGPIPLVTEDVPLNSPPPKQATTAQLFSYVESELKAIKPQLPAPGAAQYGRVDQGAVDMLLAKLYLNALTYTGTARWSDALAAAQEVIASGAYQLDANYAHLFAANNNTSKEVIFAITQDGVHTQTWGGVTFLIHAEVGGNMNASDFGIDGGWWGLRAKPELVSDFPGGANSADKRAMFYTNGQTQSMNSLTDFGQGLAVTKWTNVTFPSKTPGSNSTFVDTDYPVFRLGDAYLIYAEAALRGGGGSATQALAYVNALRDRAYGNATGEITGVQLTLPFILGERARELYWEGTRRTDLVRFGEFTTSGIWAFKGGVAAGKTTDAFRNLYPLPGNELLANPNLKQNTGY